MAKRHERTLARRMAVQVLYEGEITDILASEIVLRPDAVPDGGALPAYAVSLVEGVCAHRVAIDNKIAAASENWSVDRMPLVDRAIMRLAVFEMTHCDDVPLSVSINEAVELAKEFGGADDSARFVNGILGRIARQDNEDAELPELSDMSDAVDESDTAGEKA